MELINATAPGAQIRGFTHVPLAAALADQPAEKALSLSAENQPAADIHAQLNSLSADLKSLLRIVTDSATLAKDKNPSAAVLHCLNANDAAMKKLGLAKDIAGLNAQAIILRITEQGDEVDAAEFYQAMARAAREVRHWARKVC